MISWFWLLYCLLYGAKVVIRVQYYTRLAAGDDPRPFLLKTFGYLLTKDWTPAAEKVSLAIIVLLELPLLYLLVMTIAHLNAQVFP